MTVDGGSSCQASFAALRLPAIRPGTTGASLPAEVADILRQRGIRSGSVLLLVDHPLPLAKQAATAHFELASGALSDAAALLSERDVAAVVMVLAGPRAHELEPILAALAPLLAPGVLLVATLPASSAPAENPAERPTVPAGLGRYSMDEREPLHLSLLRSGYDQVWVHSHRKRLCFSAKRASAARAARACSIIVPVFNERETFPELMGTLLAKRWDHLGLEREIILVESNSTDGTRELVAGFAESAGVKILWQDRPRGKGHAVREALKVATGDIVLIQDADLEYDLNDYDALLEPLLQDRAAFVLGSRHSGRVRIRKFTDQRLLGAVLDAAHVLFTAVLNLLYGQNMKDPFTMFKVFRRDCIYGLQFECNRFDFDHELVIKLLLKGYRPLEIPVNYCSRSFKQGKKIRFFRDPPTWIVADLKYRLQRLRPRFQ